MLVLQRWLTSSTRGHPYDKTGTEQGESLSWLHSEVSQSLPRLPGPGLCWWWGQAERQALKERKISQQLLVHLPVGFIPWSVQMFVSVVHLSTGHPRTPHRCPTTLPCLPVCSFPIRLLVSSLSWIPLLHRWWLQVKKFLISLLLDSPSHPLSSFLLSKAKEELLLCQAKWKRLLKIKFTGSRTIEQWGYKEHIHRYRGQRQYFKWEGLCKISWNYNPWL